jgi:hypothetical protein
MKTALLLPRRMLAGNFQPSQQENIMAIHPINPATGLPMTGDDYSGVDVGGSPYGTDTHSYRHPWSSTFWDCTDACV